MHIKVFYYEERIYDLGSHWLHDDGCGIHGLQ